MKTTFLFILSLVLWYGFSSFVSVSHRPDGWYYMFEGNDNLSVEPIVTVTDFAELELDSMQDADKSGWIYQITGRLTEAKQTKWAKATKQATGKHIAFLFNGVVLTTPLVKSEITNGNFFITTDKVSDIKSLYRQICKEAGCKEEYKATELPEAATVHSFGVLKGVLIGVLLLILCIGFLRLRKIKREAE